MVSTGPLSVGPLDDHSHPFHHQRQQLVHQQNIVLLNHTRPTSLVLKMDPDEEDQDQDQDQEEYYENDEDEGGVGLRITTSSDPADDDDDDDDEGCETAESNSTSPMIVQKDTLANSASSPEDDELTSLSWLQDRNLLRVLRNSESEKQKADSENANRAHLPQTDSEDMASIAGNDGARVKSESPTSDFGEDCGDGVPEGNYQHQQNGSRNGSGSGGSSNCGGGSGGSGSGGSGVYDPKTHIHTKPPYSFSSLIFMAIEASPEKALPVKDVYAWILSHFPYFLGAPTGWKNSVRHNLSLNKCFRKVDRDKGQNIGKGSLWCIDPEYRPNLLQALRKVPYCSYQHLQMLASATTTSAQQSRQSGGSHLHESSSFLVASPTPSPYALNATMTTPRTVSSPSSNGSSSSFSSTSSYNSSMQRNHQALNASRVNDNLPNPKLFPYLSKRLAASTIKEQEVDAAATMLALKNGPSFLNSSEEFNIKSNAKKSLSLNLSVDSTKANSKRIKNGAIVVTVDKRKKRLWDRNRRSAQKEIVSSSATPPSGSVIMKQSSPCTPSSSTNANVITCSPSEDHTYSAVSSPLAADRQMKDEDDEEVTEGTASVSPSSVDGAYEFEADVSRDGSVESRGTVGSRDADIEEDEDDYYQERKEQNTIIKNNGRRRKSNKSKQQNGVKRKLQVNEEDTEEEQLKIVQGADALLNLAGYRLRSPPVSTHSSSTTSSTSSSSSLVASNSHKQQQQNTISEVNRKPSSRSGGDVTNGTNNYLQQRTRKSKKYDWDKAHHNRR